jgi:hypothetical protein
MYPVNINHGTIDVAKEHYRANGMGVVRDGIYAFIWSSVRESVMKFIFIASKNCITMNYEVCES